MDDDDCVPCSVSASHSAQYRELTLLSPHARRTLRIFFSFSKNSKLELRRVLGFSVECSSVLEATLELARKGRLELQQDGPFAPILIRAA